MPQILFSSIAPKGVGYFLDAEEIFDRSDHVSTRRSHVE